MQVAQPGGAALGERKRMNGEPNDPAALQEAIARLTRQVAEKDRELARALEREAATRDVLRTISRAPTDLRLALEAIVARAAQVCDAQEATIRLVRDGAL